MGAVEKFPAPTVTAVVLLKSQFATVVLDPPVATKTLYVPAVHAGGAPDGVELGEAGALTEAAAEGATEAVELVEGKGDSEAPGVAVGAVLPETVGAPVGEVDTGMQALEPGLLLKVPAAQAVQAVEEVAAAREEYMPAAQTVQADVPVDRLLYAPAAHAVHTAGAEAVGTSLNAPTAHVGHASTPPVATAL